MHFHRRKRPHIYPPGATFFITWRLIDSLPQSLIASLKEKLDLKISQIDSISHPVFLEKEKKRLRRQIFGKYEAVLDKNPYGSCILKDTEIAKLLSNKIHQYNNVYYKLLSYSIMTNHVHILVDTSVQLNDRGEQSNTKPKYVQVNKWMQLIKGGSARQINLKMGKTGESIWSEESFDHYIRTNLEKYNIHKYILNNPIKAKLPKKFCLDPYLFDGSCPADFGLLKSSVPD